jgi:hypothetical protein
MSSHSPDTDEPKSFAAAWTATLLLLVVFIIGLLIFPPLYDAPKSDPAELVLFVGRFHPILLHLPVGVLGLLCLFELICSTRRGEAKFGDASLIMLVVGRRVPCWRCSQASCSPARAAMWAAISACIRRWA